MRATEESAELRDDGFLHRMIDVGEVRLHVAEARPAGSLDDAPLAILLHGFPEHWWAFHAQLRALADAGYWAVAPDMRGYNESDKPEGISAYAVPKLTADVAGLIQALGRDDAFLAGHDWGGAVAWHFASAYPERLRRLAILNAAHPVALTRGLFRPAQLWRSAYIFFFQLPWIPEWAVSRNDFARIRAMFEEDGLAADVIERNVAAIRQPAGPINYYRASMRRAVPPPRVIDKPVMIIWGDRDRFLGPELTIPPRELVADPRIVHIPEATHWVAHDAPEKVSAALIEHFGAAARTTSSP